MKLMRWRYTIRGEHVHITVFVNGAMSGRLCMTSEEFHMAQMLYEDTIEFIGGKEDDSPQ